MVNMEEAPSGSGRKWNVTNLDGSFHKHVKYGGQPEQLPLQTTVINKPTDPTPEYEAKITAGLRSEAISKAHDENMEASEKLRHTIQGVIEELIEFNKNFRTFNEIARDYLVITKK
jgi:hypothetical protein